MENTSTGLRAQAQKEMEKNYLYFHDFFEKSEEHIHGIEKILADLRTPYQHVQLVQSPIFGKMLIIDGDIQSTSKDEYIYHESLVHPAMLLSEKPENAIILGGGEGATLREVLKHKSIVKALMIDIDKDAIQIAKKYLQEWHQGAFENPKAKVLNLNARKFMETQVSTGSVDVIISDLTEPFEDGPSYKLFTKEFFEIINDRLKDRGVFALQASILRITTFKMHLSIRNTLKKIFPVVRSYYAYIPSFDTTWGFIIASKKYDPLNLSANQINSLISERIEGQLKFYDGDTHIQMLSLPKDIKLILSEDSEIITDQNPVFLPRK
jgi:spermidine synthase